MLHNLSLFFQILTAILGVCFYYRYKNNCFYSYFLILIILTSIVESIGNYLLHETTNSYYFSYIFIIIQNLLITLMFTFLIRRKKIIYVLFFFFSILWILFFGNQDNIHYVVIGGAINTAFFSLIYLNQLLLSDKIFVYSKLFSFWVSVAFFIFYFSSIPFFTLFKYMQNRGLFFILNILIILMNSLIIYGLLTCNKEEKY